MIGTSCLEVLPLGLSQGPSSLIKARATVKVSCTSSCSLASRKMENLPQDIDIDTVRKLYWSIITWLPRRFETVKVMERVAKNIKAARQDGNGLKLAGSAMGFVSSTMAGVLGLASIFATGGLSTPLIAAGGFAGVLGIGGAVTSIGGEIAKYAQMPSISIVQEAFEKELDEYHTVIENLKMVHKYFTEKGVLDSYYQSLLDASLKAISEVIIDMITTGTFAHDYLSEIASAAASKAVTKVLEESSKEITPEMLKEAAKRAAKEAVYGSNVGTMMSKILTSPEAISEAVGGLAGEIAFKEAAKEGSLMSLSEIVKHTSASAGRRVGREMFQETVEGTAEFIGAATGGSAGATFGKFVGKSLPILNFAFAGWDAHEFYKAREALNNGSEEEKDFKRQIITLKDEANKIVRDIYNPLAQQFNLAVISIPFP